MVYIMVYSCIIIISIIIIIRLFIGLSSTINSLYTELAERDTINQLVIYCTLIGGCLKWIPSQESTPDRSPLMAVYNWLIHIEWTPCFSRVSEVYVFFPKQTLGVGSLQTCQRGKENQCLRQCGMSLSLHFIGMFTTVEFRMKLLELVVYRAAIGHKQNVWLKTASSVLDQIEVYSGVQKPKTGVRIFYFFLLL